MPFSELPLMASMTPDQRALFQTRYSSGAKSRTTATVLALLLGGIGAHHFYLGKIGLGVLYLLFVWTLVPAMLGVLEAFFMGGRVDRYNERVATAAAADVRSLSTEVPA